MKVFWNYTNRILDLKNAPAINEVSLYRLDGKQLFKCIVLPRMHLLHTGFFQWYLYSSVKGNNNLLYTSKLSSNSKIINISHSGTSSKNIAAVSSVQLNFKHDDYYPHSIDVFDFSDDLVISLKRTPK